MSPCTEQASSIAKEATLLPQPCNEEKDPPIPIDRNWIQKLLKKYPNPNSRRQDGKALVVAPMVDQSDKPFRLLCRRYGSNLCFTPMIHSRLILESKSYQSKFMSTDFDRPIIAQLCGSDPETVLKAAQLLEPYVDGIDINCGCPQGIARRGDYGAFLLDQEEKLLTLVRHLIKHLRVPLSLKVRLLARPSDDPIDIQNFDTPQQSLRLYEKLVDAGIHLLTIHGRTRKQKGPDTGLADWVTIRKAVEKFGSQIPIFANGSIQTYDDVEKCLQVTNADGIMSSESILEYPPLFYKIPQEVPGNRTIGRVQVAEEYMELAKKFPPNKGGQGSGVKCMRVHIHRFLHADLQADVELRTMLCQTMNLHALEVALQNCKQYHEHHNHDVAKEELSWYTRHQGGQGRVGNDDIDIVNDGGDSAQEGTEEDADGAACTFYLFGDGFNGDDEEKGDY